MSGIPDEETFCRKSAKGICHNAASLGSSGPRSLRMSRNSRHRLLDSSKRASHLKVKISLFRSSGISFFTAGFLENLSATIESSHSLGIDADLSIVSKFIPEEVHIHSAS